MSEQTHLERLTELHNRGHAVRELIECSKKNTRNPLDRFVYWLMIRRTNRMIVALAREMNRVAVQDVMAMHYQSRIEAQARGDK